jgi:hypothetical protein
MIEAGADSTDGDVENTLRVLVEACDAGGDGLGIKVAWSAQ